jgi:hypothetical protein
MDADGKMKFPGSGFFSVFERRSGDLVRVDWTAEGVHTKTPLAARGTRLKAGFLKLTSFTGIFISVHPRSRRFSL